MKQILTLTLCASLLAFPVTADTTETEEGPSLVEEGLQLFLRDLLEEMEPTFDDLREFTKEMGPALEELREKLGDMSDYHTPEVLDNGDIIIRRKTPLEVPLKEGEIEI
ncbi:MAG: hypothetical protein ABJO67_04845 [Pseudoruegeria sp.]